MSIRLLQVSIIIVMTMLMGCSLLKFELVSDAVPLTPEQQQLRTVAREFGERFFTAVEKTSTEIQSSDTESIYKEHAILWKINAEAVAIDAIYKNQPAIAFIDMWAFTIQMEEFFTTDTGKKLFGPWTQLILTTATQMRKDIETIAKNNFKSADYTKIVAFITSYVHENPITDLTFKRYPIYSVWLAKTKEENQAIKKDKDNSKEVTPTTVGTLPEVMSDLSDRMAAITRQLQKNVVWQTELLALNGDIDVKLLGKTVDNVYYSSVQLKDIFLNKEGSMEYLASQFALQIRPLVTSLDTMFTSYLSLLQQEGDRLGFVLVNERIALEKMVERERIAILDKVSEIRELALKQVMEEVTSLIKNTLWLLIILFTVILCIPFGFGVMFGKLLHLRKKR